MTSLAPRWFPEKVRDWLIWPKTEGDKASSKNIPNDSPENHPGGAAPRPGGGRRPRSEKPKPGSIDDVGAALEALHAAQAALRAERALQAKRVAALAECRQGFADAPARDFADLQRGVEEAKKQFEELQAALKDEVAKQLTALDKFNADYDKLWAEALRGTEEYLRHYPEIMVDLQKIWDEYGNREWARQVAEWVDTAIQAAMAGLDAYHLGAGLVKGLAAESAEAAQLVGGAAAREEAAAARGVGALERNAAEAERVAFSAEETALQRAEREAVERAQRDVANAEKRLAEGRAQEIRRAETEAQTLERAGKDAEAATSRAAQGEAEAQLARQEALNQLAKENAAALKGPYATTNEGRAILMGDDLGHATAAAQIPPKPGYFDVFVHGSEKGNFIVKLGGQKLVVTPEELLLGMKANGYQGGPVRLISCWSGGKIGASGHYVEGAADGLSHLLGGEHILAPQHRLVFSPKTGQISVQLRDGTITNRWTTYGSPPPGVGP